MIHQPILFQSRQQNSNDVVMLNAPAKTENVESEKSVSTESQPTLPANSINTSIKKVDNNILELRNGRFKYIGYSSFSDFLSIKIDEQDKGWILPEVKQLEEVLSGLLSDSNKENTLQKLGLNMNNLMFLTKERRIDSRSQEFSVKVVDIQNGSVKVAEVAENEIVNVLLQDKDGF